MNSPARLAASGSSVLMKAIVRSLAGAFDQPSPMISVVTPCVTLLMTRPSPVKQGLARVALDVDEPGADDQPFRIDPLLRRCVFQQCPPARPVRSGRP